MRWFLIYVSWAPVLIAIGYDTPWPALVAALGFVAAFAVAWAQDTRRL